MSLSQELSGKANKVIVGLNFTLVLGPYGIGLAHTPERNSSGCRSLPSPGFYQGEYLAQLGILALKSKNIFERAIGFAAINAHYNRYDLEGSEGNGLDALMNQEVNTVVVGRFPSNKRLDSRISIIERTPIEGEYPESHAEELLCNAEQVLITASTLANGTLNNFLSFIPKSASTILLGPSAPLSPKLFEYGLTEISGVCAKNESEAEKLAKVVAEGGSIREMKHHRRLVTLKSI